MQVPLFRPTERQNDDKRNNGSSGCVRWKSAADCSRLCGRNRRSRTAWNGTAAETDGIYSALGRIRKVLESRVTYSENPGAIPEDEDPVLWFLDESKEGNAMLYASTAVEALRAKGIPARYVEGYFLSESAPTGEKGQAELTGNDAHAWVEIYFDGIGWLPADVTPGYYYNVASLQKKVGSPDSVQKNVALENNSLSAEQITGVENRKSKAGEAEERKQEFTSIFVCGA